MGEFCATAGIRNWEVFKNGNNIRQFYSRNLRRDIIICSDLKSNPPEHCWTASEIEYVFKKNCTTDKLDKIDKIKNKFKGKLVLNEK